MAAHSSVLPGESHGQRSLAGYSPWGHKELDTPEQLRTAQCCLVTVLAKLICRFYVIHVGIADGCSIKIENLILRFIWNRKGRRIANTILKEKIKVGGLTPFCFQNVE